MIQSTKRIYDTTTSHCTHYKMPLQWVAPLTENNLCDSLPLYERVERQKRCLVHRFSQCGLHIVYHISVVVVFFFNFLLFLMYGLFIFVSFNSFNCYGTFFFLHNFPSSQ